MGDNAAEDAALIAKLTDMDLLPNKDGLEKNEYISLRNYAKKEVFVFNVEFSTESITTEFNKCRLIIPTA